VNLSVRLLCAIASGRAGTKHVVPVSYVASWHLRRLPPGRAGGCPVHGGSVPYECPAHAASVTWFGYPPPSIRHEYGVQTGVSLEAPYIMHKEY